jgi:hypothetical protein
MIFTNFLVWTLALMWSMRHADVVGMALCIVGFLFMHFMIEERDGDDGNQF